MGPGPYKSNENLIGYQSLGYAYACLRACAHPHYARPSMSSVAKVRLVLVPLRPSTEEEHDSRSIVEGGCLRVTRSAPTRVCAPTSRQAQYVRVQPRVRLVLVLPHLSKEDEPGSRSIVEGGCLRARDNVQAEIAREGSC
ncbi:hypothetical protein CRG98_021280 [Punica granatum]|uniref:Uncharacterized protein n=1 Tax=Punica granatum TaxID=22663 RepID=A0A2I0JPX6_PUNGR|nr:hypothetical protein CRG98_021280 [Punica granatum]